MKVAVIGSRSFNDMELVTKVLDSIQGISLIVSGGARGADRMGESYADSHGISKTIFYADWDNVSHPQAQVRINRWGKKYDAAAGFRRNKDIVDNSDLVVAFWDGQSRGTKHAIEYARSQHKKVQIIETALKLDPKVTEELALPRKSMDSMLRNNR